METEQITKPTELISSQKESEDKLSSSDVKQTTPNINEKPIKDIKEYIRKL